MTVPGVGRRFAALLVLPLVAALAIVPSAAQAADNQAEVQYEPPLEQCTILGTPGDDRLIGTLGDDVICGLGGNDILIGLSGDDELYGGEGDDRLYGGNGDDLLVGGPGADIVRGGPGDDTMEGPGESSPDGDSLEGEEGVDTIVNGGVGLGVSVTLAIRYDLPRGTKVEWFYNLHPAAAQCLTEWAPNWTHTVGSRGEITSVHAFTTPTAADSFSCSIRTSYATWQVRVTSPDAPGNPWTGSLFVQTGAPNPTTNIVYADCSDWRPKQCVGGVWRGFSFQFDATLPVTLSAG